MGSIQNPTLLFSILFIVTLSTSNAQQLLVFPHLAPHPKTTTHAPAPAPAPSHHHHHHHHNHSHHAHSHSPALAPSLSPTPSSAPIKQPSKPVIPPPQAPPPAKGPTTQPPPKAPITKPPTVKRKFVAVQGMVYCKNCSYSGVNTLLGASPLSGARVVLRCRNTRYILRKATTTDINGYFFLQAPPLLTTYGAHKCKVYLAHRPNNNSTDNGPCSNVTDLNNGASGAFLFSNNTGPPKPLPTFSLFSVGPFAYESTKCHKNSTSLV